MACVCEVVVTLLVLLAVMLDGVPSVRVRLAANVPPPVKPLPAIIWVAAAALVANALSAAVLLLPMLATALAISFFSHKVRLASWSVGLLSMPFSPPITGSDVSHW